MLAELAALGALGFVGYKAIELSSSASATPPAAPPLPPVSAPSIKGHVIPTAPPPMSPWLAAANAQMSANLRAAFPSQPGIGIPKIRQDGLWVYSDNESELYQFHDCSGKALGRAGYMPLQYKQFLDAGVNCDGTPIAATTSSSGGLDPVAQTAIQVGTTAAVAAGTAAAGGSGAAAAAAAAAGAALAALGPIADPIVPPDTGSARAWRSTRVDTLVVRAGDRVLGINVFRTVERPSEGAAERLAAHGLPEAPPRHTWTIAAVETSVRAAEERGAPGLSAMYADHAHHVIGTFPVEEYARKAAEAFGAAWRTTKLRERYGLAPCPCDPIPGVSPAALEVVA